MHVALHRRKKDLAARFADAGLLGGHEGQKVRDGLLHGARAFHHLRQEHLARAEEVAHHAHASHKRSLDDSNGLAEFQTRLFDIGDYKIRNAVDEGVLQPLLDGVFTPAQIFRALLAFAFDLSGDLDQTLGGVGTAIPDHIFHALAHIRGNVGIDAKLSGVHNAHVEAGADSVVQEHGVHRLAHGIVTPEREGQIGDAARDVRAWTSGLETWDGFDEVFGVAVVLLHAGGHGEHVGIENDIARFEAGLVDEQTVGALADLHAPLDGDSLAFFVEGHHDDGGAVPLHSTCLGQEFFLAFLE